MAGGKACGKATILTLMNLDLLKGWKARLLDYRTSGDATGDKTGGVVGDASAAFHELEGGPAADGAAPGYSREEKRFLMDLARRAAQEAVRSGNLPPIDEQTVPVRLCEKKGCFVTLTQGGALRGCIGHILPLAPLFRAVMENARSAALHDSRFEPVRASELAGLEFEISVLTEPRPLEFSSPEDLLNKLRPRQDGVVLKVGGRASTFLPQVWEQLPRREEFLNRLAMKAGGAPGDWRKPGAAVSIYQVVAFKEADS